MLTFAEGWAEQHGYQELALDTPQPAQYLVGFYMNYGYRPVESVRFEGKNYRSVVLSKAVEDPDSARVLSLKMKRWLCLAGAGIGRAMDVTMRTPTAAQVG